MPAGIPDILCIAQMTCIGNCNVHGLYNIDDLTRNFSVLKKCNGKLDCLIYEMLFIRKKKPSLNTQSDWRLFV